MSGKRYLLDTNAVVALLRGEASLADRLERSSWVGISIISWVEFLSFPELGSEDEQLFLDFSRRVHVVGISQEEPLLLKEIIRIRKKHRLRLPDAIVAATALVHQAVLVTADRDFSKVSSLDFLRL